MRRLLMPQIVLCFLLATCSCSRNDGEEIVRLRRELEAAKAEAAAARAELAQLKSPPKESGAEGLLTQRGEFKATVGRLEIFYPRPFASPPELKITDDGDLTSYELVEQRANGFRLEVRIAGANGKLTK